jgi:hypothetical protein
MLSNNDACAIRRPAITANVVIIACLPPPLAGFLVEDVYAKCDEMVRAGVPFPKKPGEGGIKDIAFAADPDGYWVRITHCFAFQHHTL